MAYSSDKAKEYLSNSRGGNASADTGMAARAQSILGIRDTSTARSWGEEYDRAIESYNKASGLREGKWTNDSSRGHRKRVQHLLDTYSDAYEEEDGTGRYSRAYDNLKRILDSFDEGDKYYSQWSSQEDFDKYRSGYTGQTFQGNQFGLDDKGRAALREQLYANSGKNADALKKRMNEIERSLVSDADAAMQDYFMSGGSTKDYAYAHSQEYRQLQKELQAEETYARQYERSSTAASDKWKDYAEAAQKSNVDTTYNGVTLDQLQGVTEGGDFGSTDDQLGLFLQIKEAKDSGKYGHNAMSGYDTGDQLIDLAYNIGVDNGWDVLSKDSPEVKTYYALRAQDPELANQYLQDIKIDLSRQRSEQVKQQAAEEYEQAPITSTVKGVFNSVYGGAAAGLYDAYGALTGNYNPYNSGTMAQDYGSQIHEEVANSASELGGKIAKKFTSDEEAQALVAEFAGNTASGLLSRAESVLGALTLGGAYTWTMGLGAGAEKSRELYEKGASGREIATGAIGSGLAEAAFEYLSAGEIKWIKNYLDSPAANVWGMLARAGVSSLTEGLEELCTEYANQAIDRMNRGDFSDYNLRIAEIMKTEGKSFEEARKQADDEVNKAAAWAFYGGAVAGLGDVGAYAVKAAGRGAKNAVGDFATGYSINKLGNASQLEAQAAKLQDTKQAAKLGQQAAAVSGITADSHKAQTDIRDRANENWKVGRVAGKIARQANIESQKASVEAFRAAVKPIIEANDKINAKNKDTAVKIATKAFAGEYLLPNQEKYLNNVLGGMDFIDSVVYEKDGDTVRQEFQKEYAERLSPAMDTLMSVQNLAGVKAEEDSGTRFNSTGVDRVKVTQEDGSTSIENIENAKFTEGADGNLAVDIGGGKTAKVADITFGSYGKASLFDSISKMGLSVTEANEAIEDAQSSGIGRIAFAEMATKAYSYGNASISWDVAKQRLGNSIPEALAQKYYEYGKKYGKAMRSTGVSQKHNVTRDNPLAREGIRSHNEDGVWIADSIDVTKLNQQQRHTLAVAKLLTAAGYNVGIMNSTAEQRAAGLENGSFNTKTGDIIVDINSGMNGEGVGVFTISHEVTHAIREFDAQSWNDLVSILSDHMGETWETLVQQELGRIESDINANEDSRYANMSADEKMNYALDEAAARACQTILTDTNAIDQVAKDVRAKNPKLFNKIAELLKQIVKRIRNAYKEMFLGSGNDTERQAREMLRTCEAIRDTWVRGALNAGEAMQTLRGEAAGEQAEKNTADGGVRYAGRATKFVEDKYFQRQIDNIDNADGGYVSVGKIIKGSPIDLVGIPYGNLYFDVSKILKEMRLRGDNISAEVMKGIPRVLENPVVITGFIDNNGVPSINVYGQLFIGNSPIVVGLMIGKHRNGASVDKVQTVHPNRHVLDEITDARTLYITENKKETKSWLQALRAPKPLLGGTKTGFIKTLSQYVESVKPNLRKSSRSGEIGKNFTDTPQFRQWFGNSVVTNPDGTPKVLYHQTDAEFTVFDPRHIGAGTSDNGTPFGIFMKSDSKNIGLRGDKQMELYASIQNPLIANNREHLYRQISQMSEKYTSILKQREALDSEYHKRLEDNENAQMEYMKQWREQNQGVSSRQLYKDDFFTSLLDKDETILDEWKAAGKELDKSAKEEINRVLEANGYDGVIIREDVGSFGRKTDAYIALHPEQVKSATDNAGTFDRTNPDIRYSDRNSDSTGRQLTEAQAEYFKDSKVRDADGNLMVVYHGTPNGGFNEFKLPEFMTQVTSRQGAGYYFTDKKNAAQYMRANNGKSQKNAKLYEVYLNITNPMEITEFSRGKISPDAFREIIARGTRQWGVEHTDVDKILGWNPTDAELLQYMVSAYSGDSILPVMKEVLGYDGVKYHDRYGDIWVAWDKNQIKNTNNLNPTSNPDIRRSQRMTAETKAAIEAFRAQTDAAAKAQKAVYEAQIQQMEKSYKRQINTLEAEADDRYNDIRMKFNSIVEQYDAKVMEAGAYDEQRNELMQALQDEEARHKSDNEIWQKEFDRLTKEWESSGRSIEKLTEKVEHQRKAAKDKVERHRVTEQRARINDTVKTLQQLLLKPDTKRHVPDGLRSSVAMALEAIELNPINYQKEIDKISEELVKANKNGNTKKAEALRERLSRLNKRDTNIKAAIAAMKAEYAKIADDGTSVYDEGIAQLMDNALQLIGDKPYSDMNSQELEAIGDTYRAILHRVRTVNKAFRQAQGERIDTIVQSVKSSAAAAGQKAKLKSAWRITLDKIMWNNLKPVYAFERMDNPSMKRLFDSLRKGEDTWYRDMAQAKAYYYGEAAKYNYDQWDTDTMYTFESSSGMEFQLSLDDIMSLYAYSRRDQARDHIRKGGIVFDKNTERTVKGKLGIEHKVNVDDATAYNISDATLNDIIGKLTSEQRRFVESMQDYLSTIMGAKGNEVSMALYDIKLFGEKNYWPLRSSEDYSATAKENNANPGNKIKNSGFTKATIKNASNPVVLTGFMDTWDSHIDKMSMYHAMTLPMEDFYRVWNWKTGSDEVAATQSVQAMFRQAYGQGAVDYIDQMLKDINGGLRADPRESLLDGGLSKFKKAAVMASMSVVVQQPTAVVRAFSVIPANYFVGSRVENSGDAWEQCKNYAPIAGIKEMGRFDTNVSKSNAEWLSGRDFDGLKDAGKALLTEKGHRADAMDYLLGWAPEMADQVTWVQIWEASKRMAADKYSTLTGEALLQKAGDIFTEAIVKTQVYDSVFSRSANMRSKGMFAKMVTSFMAEPTTTINMVEDAARKFARGDKKSAGKILAAVAGSIIVNALISSVVYAGRDDDEDETYAEKYLQSATGQLVSGFNPITYIPIAKDIWSIFQGYDVERADMSLWSDLASGVTRMVTVAGKYNEDFTSEQREKWQAQMSNASWDAAMSIGNLLGIPARNLRRDIMAVVNTYNNRDSAGSTYSPMQLILQAAKEETPIWNKINTDGIQQSKTDSLYYAILSRDERKIAARKADYTSDTSYHSAIRTGLREKDPRIRQAAEAQAAGNNQERIRIAKEIIKEGFFSQDDVVMAINSEVNELKADKNTDGTPKHKSIYYTDDYVLAVANRIGSAEDIRKELIDTKVINGSDADKAEKSLKTAITDSAQDLFNEGTITREQCMRVLMANGYTEESASYKISGWEVKLELGDEYDWAMSTYNAYAEVGKPNGISPSIFGQFYARKSKITGTDKDGDGKVDPRSKRNEFIAIIDSLPLTPEQKTALFMSQKTWTWARNKHACPWVK